MEEQETVCAMMRGRTGEGAELVGAADSHLGLVQDGFDLEAAV